MRRKFKAGLFPVLIALFTCLFLSIGHAGKPLWTFTTEPDYPPTISLTPNDSAVVRYLITNQSHKTRTLYMQAITGITQLTSEGNCPNPFTLRDQESCELTLSVSGRALIANIDGGPAVCQGGGALQCYQPSPADELHITRVPIERYLITPSADGNGSINPNTPQTVLSGSTLTFSATPNTGYYVDQWIIDGGLGQKGGGTFTLANIIANHTVEVTFTQAGTIYAGLENGSVYYSTDNGVTWTNTTVPSPGHAVNGLFATSNTLYAGSGDGKIYYSSNNGILWNATAAVPGGTAINSIFVASISNVPTLFAGTANGHVYYSTDGTSWTATANPGTGAVNSLFITPGSALYAGSDDGNVYYSTNLGANWQTINGPNLMPSSPVQNVFATSNQLYINTRHTSSNSTLPPGTIDFEYAYFSDSLSQSNPTWTILSQISYTLFVNSDASIIHAGTQDGYVFSLTTGDALGFITYSPITSLFFLGN